MSVIETRPLPPQALHARYAADGGYVDGYSTLADGTVDLARYVEAFYTTGLFRVERAILRVAIRAPSTDDEARAVAAGTGERFAAWSVEAREPDQLLMCDLYGRTRSWFMVEPATDAGPVQTRLYFGSAVVASAMRKPSFRLLLGFHVLYSKALLRAARRRLRR
ncbi:MAG: hypothetical protein ACPGJF_12900 [Sinimarinibacterium flocculans]|uniref:hypothetical protein n=1 Tax=Sinimarinibacterium flocculans TaxID=985250 RepID=UPI003C55F424